MKITGLKTEGILSNKPNQLARSVLSQVPANSDLVLCSCLTGLGGKYNRKNMANFFALHAPHLRIHAPTLAINNFTLSPSGEVKWDVSYITDLYQSIRQNGSFRFPKTGNLMPAHEVITRISNSQLYFLCREEGIIIAPKIGLATLEEGVSSYALSTIWKKSCALLLAAIC